MNMANDLLTADAERVRSSLRDPGKLDGATIWVTGSGGFLGFAFVRFFQHLAALGRGPAEIVLLDNLSRREAPWHEGARSWGSPFRFEQFDVARDDPVERGLPDPDYVAHMASIASPTVYRQFPLETVDANVWGLRRLFEHARHKDPKGFLFFSSSEIYGDPPPEMVPTPEDYRGNVSCAGPRACYDESKRFGETLSWIFAQQYGMPITIVRPFNNYGPGMNVHDGRAPADFARSTLAGEDIVLHSDGSPTRTFCYVFDALHGYLEAMLHGRPDTFNIGSEGPEVTIRELAEVFRDQGKRLLGYGGKIVTRRSEDPEYLTHNPNRRRPDIRKARRILGFEPGTSLQDGVSRYLSHLAPEVHA